MKLIVDIFKHLCTNLNLDFRFGTPDENSVDANEVTYPCVFLNITRALPDLPALNGFGASIITYECSLDIRIKSELGFKDNFERVDIYEQAEVYLKTLLFQFRNIKDQNDTLLVKQFTTVSATFDKTKYDAISDGVLCLFNCIMNQEQEETCPAPITL